jgi:hypothetical protein
MLLASLFVGCKPADEETNDEGNKAEESKELTFYHFNQDEANAFKEFVEANSDYTLEVVITDMNDGSYQSKLETNFRAGKAFADLISLEAAFIRRIMEEQGSSLKDVNKLGFTKEEEEGFVKFALDMCRDKDGVLRGINPQLTSCGIFVKAEMAKNMLGTDDPAELAEYFKTEKLLETGKKIKETNPDAIVYPSYDTVLEFALGARQDPWIKDGVFTIDPEIDQFMDLVLELTKADVIGTMASWEDEWSAAHSDDTTLAFFGPAWMEKYVIAEKVKDTPLADKGFRLVKGPANTLWGGTGYAIPESTENPNNAYDVLKMLTIDPEMVEKRITAGGSPDVTSILAVNKKFADDESFASTITGQNSFKLFTEFGEGINAGLMTQYDDTIKKELQAQIKVYVEEKKDKETALADFQKKVEELLKPKGITFN